MAFFSSSLEYDGSHLRRKHSLTRESPPSTEDKSSNHSIRMRSPSASTTSVAESSDSRPPLPTLVPAGLSRGRGSAHLEGQPPEHSSTSIPFTSPTRPTYSDLVIDIAESPPLPSSSTSAASKKRSERVLPPSCRSESTSSPIPRTTPRTSHEQHRFIQSHDPSCFTCSKSHSGTRSRSATSIATPMKELKDSVGMPLSPTPKQSSRRTQITPPPQSSSMTRTESTAIFSEPVRSRSPQLPVTPTSASDNAKSGWIPVLPLEQANPRSPRPASTTDGSGSSTPSDGAKLQDSRPRNLLRKSNMNKREPASVHMSDSEHKSKTHRSRARTGVFASIRRNSISSLFDLVHSPTPTTSLTPAGDILMVYKESERVSSTDSPQETYLKSSGKLVAIGSPDDELKNPWTAGWKISHEENERDGEKKLSVGRALSRSLSQPKRPQPTSSQKETRVPKTPVMAVTYGSEHPHEKVLEGEEGEGRVWEEAVGELTFQHTRSEEDAEPTSPSRLWRLVKRFSSGSLKEKRSSTLEPAPPVPPISREFGFPRAKSSGNTEAKLHIGEAPVSPSAVMETPGGIMRYIPSMSRAKTATHSGHTSSHNCANVRSSAGASPTTSDVSPAAGHCTGARRSTATFSSSRSSENTKLFSPSRTSSDSSYGETVPPVPKTQVGQHIVPLHTLDRFPKASGEDSNVTSPPLSTTRESPTSEIAASPVSSDEANPSIPTFEVRNPFNRFMPYKSKQASNSPTPSTSDMEPLNLRRKEHIMPPLKPAIPARNPRRPSSISIPSNPQLAQNIPVQGPSGLKVDIPKHRTSTQTRTSNVRPRSTSDGEAVLGPPRSPVPLRSPLTFREVTSKKQPLTEQEKNAKWEDLLQRCDMAGGTLRLSSRTEEDLALWRDGVSLAPSEIL